MLRYLRYLRYLFLAALAICLIVVALANRGTVTLRLLPEEMGHFAGVNWAIDLPLYLVVFGGILGGLLIGFVWEWLREARFRSEASRAKREAKSLQREVKRLAGDEPKDDVIALLDGAKKAG